MPGPGAADGKEQERRACVGCHGYAFIYLDVEQKMCKQFGFTDWNRQPEDEGKPLKAIVKDYISSDSMCGGEKLSVMRTKLQQLNDIGIYHMNVKEENYRGGQLFDFSVAITRPSIWLSPKFRSWKLINEDRSSDLVAFDRMAEDINRKQTVIQKIERQEIMKYVWLEVIGRHAAGNSTHRRNTI